MILKCQVILLLIKIIFIDGEWIEMPQFSDDSKLYKLSEHNFYHEKFFNNDEKTVSDYDAETITQSLNKFGNTNGNVSLGVPLSGVKDSAQYLETATVNPFYVPEESNPEHYDEDEEYLTEILPSNTEFPTDPSIPSTLELPVDEPSVSSTVISILPEISSEESSAEKKAEEFQDYLPMDMLKKVHQTLKSQPTTLEGKIRFLKQFENDLIREIETRLSTALAPMRRTRGARDSWDHDEEMGFPSLEGALMAISFLTFAVYLVRLVMLLFRNATNSTATTATTILFRKRRKTTDSIDRKTEEILNYINAFNEK